MSFCFQKSSFKNKKFKSLLFPLLPFLGGDWATYPWGNSGSGYPTTYEETTPLCDALAVDLKLTHNLWVDTWNDPAVGLANAGYGKHTLPYYADKNVYGRYTDPYLLRINAKNPSLVDFTDDGKIVEPHEKSKKKRTSLNLNYLQVGVLVNYTAVEGLRISDNTACPTKAPSNSVTAPKVVANPEPENKGIATEKPIVQSTCPPIPTCPGR